MSTSRRRFIKAGMLAALFAASPLRSVFGQGWKEHDGNPGPAEPQNDPLSTYTKATFKYYLNSVFQLQTVAGVVEVTLKQIDDLPAAPNGECFSLLFRGGSKALKQDTYVMVHSALGKFGLFLVPAGTDDNGAQAYLATINRLSPADFLKNPAPSRQSGGAQRSGTAAPAPTPTASPTPTPLPSPSATPTPA